MSCRQIQFLRPRFVTKETTFALKNRIVISGRPQVGLLSNGLIIDILKRGRYQCAIYKHNGIPLTALLSGELCLTEQS